MITYLEFIAIKEEARDELRLAGKSDKITDNEICRRAGRANSSILNLQNRKNQTDSVKSDLVKAIKVIKNERLKEEL